MLKRWAESTEMAQNPVGSPLSAEIDETTLYLTAREAAAELGVSLATLYAYVSRDLLQSEPVPGSRAKRYRASDIRDLKMRRGWRGPAENTPSLAFGAPVLDSAITLIAEGRLFYRGADAAELSESMSLEQIAALLWGASERNPFADDSALPETLVLERLREVAVHLSPLARVQTILPAAALSDRAIYQRTPDGLARAGAHILRLAVGAAVGEAAGKRSAHERLADALAPRDKHAPELIRKALVLAADHELNPSTFAVRCAAGTGANLYQAVLAGLATLQGPRHGGYSTQVEALLSEIAHRDDTEHAVLERLGDNAAVPGFGHPLYPDGDPRARAIMAALEQSHGEIVRFRQAARAARVMREAAGLHPNLDYSLASLAAALDAPKGTAITLFGIGRIAGWIAHALEQTASGAMIRPRARYIGPTPRHMA